MDQLKYAIYYRSKTVIDLVIHPGHVTVLDTDLGVISNSNVDDEFHCRVVSEVGLDSLFEFPDIFGIDFVRCPCGFIGQSHFAKLSADKIGEIAIDSCCPVRMSITCRRGPV